MKAETGYEGTDARPKSDNELCLGSLQDCEETMGENNNGIVAIGANLPSSGGSVVDTVQAAIRQLHEIPKISITASSRYWKTPAYPAGSGPDYCNAVVLINTPYKSVQLLEILHEIETRFGRDRSSGRWSSRVLDMDLIAYNANIAPDIVTLKTWIDLPLARQTVEAPDQLILPHPRMQDRGFVLGPLAEIAPEWRHPLIGLSVRQMLDALGPEALAGMQPVCLADAGQIAA